MSETYKLEATMRDVVGKHVRHYRRQGQIPAVVYGREFTPIKIFVSELDLRHVLAQAGGTHLIELQIGKDQIPTLAREVQRHPIRGSLMHVDFYRVAMDRVIRTEVPIVLVGSSPAIAKKEAIVIHSMNTVLLECLPGELPAHVEVDMSQLSNVGDQILVGDLKLPSSIKIISPLDELVLRLDYAESVLVEEEPAGPVSAEVEVITAKKEEEEAEG